MSTENWDYINSPVEDDLEIIEEPDTVQFVETPNDEENGNTAENQNEEGESAPAENENKEEPKVKRVRNPQPKLDTERLKGPRGLTVLEDMFQKVKFKGPKHEEEDLNLLMKTYEYFFHRLYPKFPLDNCLERLERLGTTKPVQAYVKRIRLNLLTDDKPLVDCDDDAPSDNEITPNTGATAGDEFDRSLPSNLLQPTQSNNTEFDRLLSTSVPLSTQSNETGTGELTEEQLERIRLNREKAQRLRKRINISNSQLSQEVDVSHALDTNVNADQISQSTTTDITTDLNLIHFSESTKSSASKEFTTKSHTKQIIVDDSSSLELLKGTDSLATNSLLSRINLETENDICVSQVSENTADSFAFGFDFVEKSQPDIVMHDVISTSVRDDNIDNYGTSQGDLMSVTNSQETSQIDTAKMSVVYESTTSQESETLPTCMSVDSERCIGFGSAETMVVSEVDSPMDVDSNIMY